jgi:hypothetical protein
LSRLRAGAAIASSAILSVMMLASCMTDSTSRGRTPNYSALNQPIGEPLRRNLEDFRDDPAGCQTALRQSAVKMTPLPDQGGGSGCALDNAVKYDGALFAYSDLVRVSCPVAAALSVWERQVVEPLAARYLKSPVVRIEIIGSYSCRTRNSKPGAPLSEHAKGNAADIAGFRLKDGRLIMVEQTWRQDGPESDFLHDVRDRSCNLFNAVLSPDYNWEHRNHLHLDLGRDRLCR